MATAKKATAVKAIKSVTATAAKTAKKPTSIVATAKKEVKKTVNKINNAIEDVTENTKIQQIIKTSKKTSSILGKAGSALLDNSIKTTKTIASIYGKAGKKVLNIGQELYKETTKALSENIDVMEATSTKAIKETKKTLKDSKLMSMPFSKN